MIFYIICFAIMLYSQINYKKSFYLYLMFKIILYQNIAFISIPGIPLLTVDLVLEAWFSLMFFIKGKLSARETMPLKKVFCLLVISWLISTVFSVAGIVPEASRFIRNLFDKVIIAFLMWENIETKKEFEYLFKGVTIVIFVTCLYGLLEYRLNANPVHAYELTLIEDASRALDLGYGLDKRGYRISSFFYHPIGAGVNWAMYSAFVFILLIVYNYKVPFKQLSVLTALLCVPCILLTKMRSPILFFIIIFLAVVDLRKLKSFRFLSICMLCVVIGVLAFPDNLDIIKSLYDKKAMSTVGGSDLTMRLGQFDAVQHLVNSSVLFGLGEKFTNVIDNEYTIAMLGLESVWLSTLVKYGLFGIGVLIYYIYFTIFKLSKKYSSRCIFWVSVGYWVLESVTSIPGTVSYFYLAILFFCIKSSAKYKQTLEKRKMIRIKI